MTKIDVDIKNNYRIDGGNTLPIHGKVNYSMICQNGDGEIYGAADGRNVKVVSGFSCEVVGTELPPNSDASQPYVPAKWIRAAKGDVMIEAPSGTLYLNARNIVINATGSETENESNGNVDIIATNDVNITTSDTVKVAATNITMSASLAMDLAGKNFFNLAGGFSSGGSTIDLSKGILGSTGKILKSLTGIG